MSRDLVESILSLAALLFLAWKAMATFQSWLLNPQSHLKLDPRTGLAFRDRHLPSWESRFGHLRWYRWKMQRKAKITMQPTFHHDVVVTDKYGIPFFLTVDEDGTWLIRDAKQYRVGTIGVFVNEDHARIVDFEIPHPKHRGRGIGHYTLLAILDHLRQRSVLEISGRVTEDDARANPKLLTFYKQHGFEILLPPSKEDRARILLKLVK